MITWTPAHVLTRQAAVDAPGGFAWWYLDLIDAEGRGLVVIWSYGLPFLPGYASAARRGTAPPARARPSLSISAYDRGELVFYDLQEHSPAEVEWDRADKVWRFGRSRIRWRDHRGEGTRTLSMTLDRDIPGTRDRLMGTVKVHGRLCRGPTVQVAPTDDPSHVWSPMLLGCEGTASLQSGDFQLELAGRAYHDRNASTVPLHALGIGRWWWGRVSMPDGDFIWYRLQPEDGGPLRQMVFSVTRDGQISEHPVDVRLGPPVAGRFGLSSPATVTFQDGDGHPVVVKLEACVDDGPFYQRHIVRGLHRGKIGRGFAELVVPGRVDLDLHRPFVRMRVQRSAGPNSMWLPLFTGPRSGRVRRLPRWWAGAS